VGHADGLGRARRRCGVGSTSDIGEGEDQLNGREGLAMAGGALVMSSKSDMEADAC